MLVFGLIVTGCSIWWYMPELDWVILEIENYALTAALGVFTLLGISLIFVTCYLCQWAEHKCGRTWKPMRGRSMEVSDYDLSEKRVSRDFPMRRTFSGSSTEVWSVSFNIMKI